MIMFFEIDGLGYVTAIRHGTQHHVSMEDQRQIILTVNNT